MTTVAPSSYVLNTNWLSFPTTTSTALTISGNISNNSTCWYHPMYISSYRPIKLALSEVEKLLAAARKDGKLKAILQKFTDYIEITVDFE